MHLSLRYVAVIIFTLAFAVFGGVALIQTAVHSWTLPACWQCGAKQVRRSASSRLADSVVRFLFLVPYRCRGCQKRFYAFRTQRPLAQPHT